MQVIDAQIHSSAPHSARFPWSRELLAASDERRRRFEGTEATIEHVVELMDDAGVAAAVLASRGVVYGTDDSYAFAAARQFPGRFGVVGPIDADVPGAEERVCRYRDQPYGLGIRLVLGQTTSSYLAPTYRTVLRTAERSQVPVFLHVTHATGGVAEAAAVIREFPELVVILDHLGLAGLPEQRDDTELDEVLALAGHENVAIKCTGVATLSREEYPFDDVWPALLRILEAFGPDRVMWGSDITVTRSRQTYRQAVDFIRESPRLSESEKELVLAGALRTWLRWPAASPDLATM